MIRRVGLAFLVLFPAAPAIAATFTVSLDGTGDYTDIQEAIDAAWDGDEVLVRPGEYVITEALTFRGKMVEVRGEAGPGETVIRMADEPTAALRGSVVIFDSGESEGSVLRGFTLRGGRGTKWGDVFWMEGGGGILCVNASSPSIVECIITGNSAYVCGGGVSCAGGSSPTFTDCSIRENLLTVSYEGYFWSPDVGGGGVCCFTGSSPLFSRCTIAENELVKVDPGNGCGVLSMFSSPTFVQCAISGNHGARAVYCGESSVTLQECTISQNERRGVWVTDSFCELHQCVITDNGAPTCGFPAGDCGAGITCAGPSTLDLEHCTITGNRGGGVRFVEDEDEGPPTATISHCILWDNHGQDLSMDPTSRVDVAYSCVGGDDVWPGVGNINLDPLFCGWGQQGEVYVDGGNPGPGDGTQEHPFSSLAQALDGFSVALSAQSPCIRGGEGGTDIGAFTDVCDFVGESSRLVHVASGDYSLDRLSVVHHVSLRGAGETQTTLRGSVLGLRSGTVLSDVTVADSTYMGIVVTFGETPTIRRCTVSGHRSIAVYCNDSSAMITDCTITANNWQGIAVSGSPSPTITNCMISDNYDRGVFCHSGTPALLDCTITRNGGGVYCRRDAHPTFTNCTISKNRGRADDDSVYSTVGGGAYCEDESSLTLIRCTIAGNTGNGLCCVDRSSLNLADCIVWDNVGRSLVIEPDAAATVTFSCIEGEEAWPGEGNINDDPLFCGWGDVGDVHVDGSNAPPGDGTPGNPYSDVGAALEFSLALSRGSPCLDGGDGGERMGADKGLCEAPGQATRLVHVAAGSYSMRHLCLAHEVSIEGSGEAETLLEGTVLGLGSEAGLSQVTITGGPFGGIIIDEGESPRIQSCRIRENLEGGVLCGDGSAPTLTDCTIRENSGNGVSCTPHSTPTLTDCTIIANLENGVFREERSAPTLINCAIMENVEDGVQTEAPYGFATLTDCTVAANGRDGVRGSSTMANCTIVGNRGTGVSCLRQSFLTNCTIAENLDKGVFFGKSSYSNLTNSIVWNNAGGSIVVVENAHEQIAFSCGEDGDVWPGEGNINLDPRFRLAGSWDDAGTPGDPADDVWMEGDYRLQSGSPCIDAGTSEGAPVTDQDGQTRPCGDSVDIGAYEHCPSVVESRFIRGDVDGSGSFGLPDAIGALLYLFRVPRPQVACVKAIDFDDNGVLGLPDVIGLLTRIFVPGTSDPPEPYPDCSPDPTPDVLSCHSSTASCQDLVPIP